MLRTAVATGVRVPSSSRAFAVSYHNVERERESVCVSEWWREETIVLEERVHKN